MNEKDYRVDILRLKQKLFSLYPENSQGRRVLLREETLKEYMNLSKVLNIYPKEAMDNILMTSKLAIKLASFRCVFGILGVLLFGMLFAYPFGWFVKTLLGLCCGFSLAAVIFNIREILNVLKALNVFDKTERDIKEKMFRLQERLRKL